MPPHRFVTVSRAGSSVSRSAVDPGDHAAGGCGCGVLEPTSFSSTVSRHYGVPPSDISRQARDSVDPAPISFRARLRLNPASHGVSEIDPVGRAGPCLSQQTPLRPATAPASAPASWHIASQGCASRNPSSRSSPSDIDNPQRRRMSGVGSFSALRPGCCLRLAKRRRKPPPATGEPAPQAGALEVFPSGSDASGNLAKTGDGSGCSAAP